AAAVLFRPSESARCRAAEPQTEVSGPRHDADRPIPPKPVLPRPPNRVAAIRGAGLALTRRGFRTLICRPQASHPTLHQSLVTTAPPSFRMRSSLRPTSRGVFGA